MNIVVEEEVRQMGFCWYCYSKRYRHWRFCKLARSKT